MIRTVSGEYLANAVWGAIEGSYLRKEDRDKLEAWLNTKPTRVARGSSNRGDCQCPAMAAGLIPTVYASEGPFRFALKFDRLTIQEKDGAKVLEVQWDD